METCLSVDKLKTHYLAVGPYNTRVFGAAMVVAGAARPHSA